MPMHISYYMQVENESGIGLPMRRPRRASLLDDSTPNGTKCDHWTDQQLGDLAGIWPITNAFDPALHVATGGGDFDGASVAAHFTDRSAAELDAAKRQAISAEAERRINAGLTLLSGLKFRCDDKSVSRMTGIKDGPVEAFPVTFKTAAGVTVTLNNAAEARAVFDSMTKYIAAVLGASATLQDSLPDSLPADYTHDSHWPARA